MFLHKISTRMVCVKGKHPETTNYKLKYFGLWLKLTLSKKKNKLSKITPVTSFFLNFVIYLELEIYLELHIFLRMLVSRLNLSFYANWKGNHLIWNLLSGFLCSMTILDTHLTSLSSPFSNQCPSTTMSTKICYLIFTQISQPLLILYESNSVLLFSKKFYFQCC